MGIEIGIGIIMAICGFTFKKIILAMIGISFIKGFLEAVLKIAKI